MSYTCGHNVSLAKRCLDCDIQHGYIPKEYKLELELSRALRKEAEKIINPPKEVAHLIKALEIVCK